MARLCDFCNHNHNCFSLDSRRFVRLVLRENVMEYKGILRVSLNSQEFCFVKNEQIITNRDEEPLTLQKSRLDEENGYIDSPNEEGFKIPYMDDLRSEGFIECLLHFRLLEKA